MISFVVPGPPCAKQSVRFTRTGRTYQPADVLAYRDKIGWYARQAAPGVMFDCAVAVEVVARFLIPRSWSKKRQASAMWHSQKPDSDNLIKSLGDGLNGVLIRDDALIARLLIEKRWSISEEGLSISIEAL